MRPGCRSPGVGFAGSSILAIFPSGFQERSRPGHDRRRDRSELCPPERACRIRAGGASGHSTAFWRSVGPSHNVFVVESFIDELAAAANQDPLEYRRALLDNAPRAKAVLDLAAEKAGWGQPLPQGRVAAYRSSPSSDLHAPGGRSRGCAGRRSSRPAGRLRSIAGSWSIRTRSRPRSRARPSSA